MLGCSRTQFFFVPILRYICVTNGLFILVSSHPFKKKKIEMNVIVWYGGMNVIHKDFAPSCELASSSKDVSAPSNVDSDFDYVIINFHGAPRSSTTHNSDSTGSWYMEEVD